MRLQFHHLILDEIIPHYPASKRTARIIMNDNAYFNIEQFGNVRIEQVSDSNGNIPQSAFTNKIIMCHRLFNCHYNNWCWKCQFVYNNFVTFDNTLNTFDEDVGGGNTRQQVLVVILTSYDETGTKFDTTQ